MLSRIELQRFRRGAHVRRHRIKNRLDAYRVSQLNQSEVLREARRPKKGGGRI